MVVFWSLLMSCVWLCFSRIMVIFAHYGIYFFDKLYFLCKTLYRFSLSLLTMNRVLLLKFWRFLYIFLRLLCVCCLVSLVFLQKLYCKFVSHSQFLFYILHCTVFFRVFRSPSHFFPTTTFIVLNALFALALNLLICSSQFNLLFSVVPKNWALSLEGIILFLSMISNVLYFFF